jgi:hypothetical protein
MENVFETIGHDIKVGVEDVGKGVEEGVEYAIIHPIEFCVKAEKVLASAIKDRGEVKAAVLDLVKQASGVIDDVAIDVADKGFNLREDAKTLSDAEAFFAYFRSTFIPLVEKLYAEIKADTQ